MTKPRAGIAAAVRDAAQRVGQAVRPLRDAYDVTRAAASSPEAAALVRDAAQAGLDAAGTVGSSVLRAAPVVVRAAAQMAWQAAESACAAAARPRVREAAPAPGRDRADGGVPWERADAAAELAHASRGGPGPRGRHVRGTGALEVWTAQAEPEDGDVTDAPVVFA